MEQLSIKDIIKKKNLIVPEIQREYVWGLISNQILEEFLQDIIIGLKDSKKHEGLKKEALDNKIKSIFEEKGSDGLAEIQKIKDEFHAEKAMDIGFLYTYRPNYINNDEIADLFLIDGQQRFTSLFLLCFYLSIKLKKKDLFLKDIRFDKSRKSLAFNYRVRNLTQDFMLDLINNSNTIDDLNSLSKKTWYLENYKNDTTIKSINEGFQTINRLCFSMDEADYDFILNRVRFWHFNTNATSQGEELYITMNSRGKAISDNENIRALLFEEIEDKTTVITWGRKWEIWQDLFWKKKGNNSNADRGFDSFLMCIAGLENYLADDKSRFVSHLDYLNNKISIRFISNSLSLEKIEKYYDGFVKLKTLAKTFKSHYSNIDWLQKAIGEIWIILNSKTNWFADFNDANRTTEQRRMVFIWSLLLYLSDEKINESFTDEIFRMLRIYYLRFNNNVRSVVQIKKDVEGLLHDGVWQFEFGREREEENLKHRALLNSNSQVIREMEQIIWELEDHRYNLDGSDMNSINSSHLIDYTRSLAIENLSLIKQSYFEFVKFNEKKAINLLISYGPFWQKVTPNYYYNYRFNNWRRTIRDNVFKIFFKEFLMGGLTIEKFYQNRLDQITIEYEEDSEDLHYQLVWYVKNIDAEKMWDEGFYISISGDNYNALHKINGHRKDKYFKKSKKIFNTKGNLNGGNPNLLSKLVKAT
ncbi:DUF262 domain-containing protein [Flavobacterium pallidum]|uniref:GmrSD restriction endonucleases N-terminal domain-containing protein n=1 Tax=Flavobacterium pallidum TaxID=2172098 RepID=A0A2S1SHH0_9FLAO|nr:DUF262 domain-containing protein [Flavobacterium pallidum]AWI25797.1 hypothetical protein HYN49_07715 [Flavobacterium pallidum]